MNISILCHKCQDPESPITVTEEQQEEFAKLGQPISAAHETCPRDLADQLPDHKWRIQVSVWMDDEEEPCAMFGGEAEAKNFSEAMPGILKAMNESWEQVQKMAPILDAEASAADIKAVMAKVADQETPEKPSSPEG